MKSKLESFVLHSTNLLNTVISHVCVSQSTNANSQVVLPFPLLSFTPPLAYLYTEGKREEDGIPPFPIAADSSFSPLHSSGPSTTVAALGSEWGTA